MKLALVGAALALAEPRAEALPPTSFAALDDPRPVRVWWEDDGQPRVIEARVRGRWRVVAEGALPGERLDALPRGAALRLSVPGQPAGPAIAVRWSLDPAAVARLAAPEGLPGVEVADLAATPEGVWVALLEGGLAFAPKDALAVEPMGLAEGLPHPRVLSVAVDGDALWVGTAGGLARVEDGRVVGVWTRELPDLWVQDLAVPGPGRVWVGTWGGLVELGEGALLAPGPVFSVVSLEGGQGLAGAGGLRALPSGRALPVGAELEIWDVSAMAGRLHLATAGQGLLVLEGGVLETAWRGPGGQVFALQRQGGLLYAAAGVDGLVALSPEGPPRLRGPGDGLPGGAVTALAPAPAGKLWVGTDGGLALLWPEQDVVATWPVSPLAAGRARSAAVAGAGWALVGGADGLVALGSPPRGWRDALALPGPVRHLFVEGDTLWVVGEHEVWRARRGRLERTALPVQARRAALSREGLWVSGGGGLFLVDGEGGLRRMPLRGEITALAADGLGLCWALVDGALVAVDAAGGHHGVEGPGALRALAWDGEALWLAGDEGLSRLDPATRRVQPLGGPPMVAVSASPGQRAVALDAEGQLHDALRGLLLATPEETARVGEGAAVFVDTQGRVWLTGALGVSLLPSPGGARSGM